MTATFGGVVEPYTDEDLARFQRASVLWDDTPGASGDIVRRLLATVSARDEEIARLEAALRQIESLSADEPSSSAWAYNIARDALKRTP